MEDSNGQPEAAPWEAMLDRAGDGKVTGMQVGCWAASGERGPNDVNIDGKGWTVWIAEYVKTRPFLPRNPP